MRLLEIVTNWIILICLMMVPVSLTMAIAATAAHLIVHGWN